MQDYRIIVSHPGKQHSFHMASAVKKAGYLEKYVTTVYNKKGSFTNFITSRFLKGKDLKKASSRVCVNLKDDEVKQMNEWMGLVTLLSSRIRFLEGFTRYWNEFTGSCFYKRVMKYARKKNVNGVIVYDGYSNRHLELLKNTAIVKIMDVSFASRQYLKNIFEKEIKQYMAEDLYRTSAELWVPRWMDNDLNATKNADYFFAPSNFVKSSLEYCGIPSDKIYIVPYGVDQNNFSYEHIQFRVEGKLKLLYVGEISCRKGLHRLLKVVSELEQMVEIRLCGRVDENSPIFSQYQEYDNIEFVGFVTHDELAKEYINADAFVFPTLGEGYGLVVLEALSCGLPVLCSNRAGGNDVIQDGINGYVISMDEDEALKERIIWCCTHRKELYEMREDAHKSVEAFSWESYEKKVAECINDIMRRENNYENSSR